jgi:hypothetical protein
VLDFGERFPETLDFNFFSDILFCRALVSRKTSVAIFLVPRMYRHTGFCLGCFGLSKINNLSVSVPLGRSIPSLATILP